jgi:hypothetical protein
MEKNKAAGILGTVLVHALLLLLLLFVALRTPLPLPGEEGMEVNLGYSDQGFGDVQPLDVAAAQTAAVPPPTNASQEKLVTTDDEESPAVTEKPKKKAEPKSTQPSNAKPTESKPTEPQINKNALYTGKTKGTQAGGNQGIAGGVGDQGNPNGTPNSTNYAGHGGAGDGIQFQLKGRGKIYLNQPPYDSDEQGRVVVEIIVDREGTVIRATAGKKIPGTGVGTNVTDSKLWNLAKQAALKSKFTPDPKALEEQVGYITYNFIKLN